MASESPKSSPTTSQSTPSPPSRANETSPPSSPPPKSPPPASSPPPPAKSAPSPSPPPQSASSPPPEAPNNLSPPPPSPPNSPPSSHNSPSPPPPTSSKTPQSSPPSPPTTPPPSSSPPSSNSPPASSNPPPPSSNSPPGSSNPPPPSSNSPLASSNPPPPSSNSPPTSSDSLPTSSDSPPTSSNSPPTSSDFPPTSSNSPPTSSSPPAAQTSPSLPSISLPSKVPPGTPRIDNSSGNEQQVPHSTRGGGVSAAETVAITSAVILASLGILAIVACCVWTRNKRRAFGRNVVYVMPNSSQESPNNSDSSLLKRQNSGPKSGNASSKDLSCPTPEAGGFGNSRSWFTYTELVEATNGFSSENLLGEGGFGSVYKGSLVDGRVIAVKQLKIGGGQGEREFRAEVEIISRIHHRHLVSLVGYCISKDRRLLVYDYLPNNNLYFHLHGEGRPFMDWATRVKIAVGAARGVAYLHEDCHPRIIHRDIKSSNILLDQNFEARVSDFGLAKLAMDSNTHVTTRVVGTFGYMAPEYASSGKLTEKSDVYSFGVVLLELITGRKPVDSSLDESLVEWARPLLSQALERQEFEALVDPKLETHYVDVEMLRMIEAAAACVRYSSSKRPKMGQVVRALDSMVNDLTNGMKVGESEIFNGEDSAELRLFKKMAFANQNFSTGFFNSWGSESTQLNSPRSNQLNSPRSNPINSPRSNQVNSRMNSPSGNQVNSLTLTPSE